MNFQRHQSDGTSALMAASRLGDAELVRHLLALGARGDGSVRDKFGLCTVDHARATAGHAAIVNMLEGEMGEMGGMGHTGDTGGGGSKGGGDQNMDGGGGGGGGGGGVGSGGSGSGDDGDDEDDYVYDMYCVPADRMDASLQSDPDAADAAADRFGAEVLRLQAEYSHQVRKRRGKEGGKTRTRE